MTDNECRGAGIIPSDCAGLRFDQALARLHPEYSRSMWAKWIMSGEAKINACASHKRDKVAAGDHYTFCFQLHDKVNHDGQAIPLTILFEDEDILVINKPAGLVVHPGAGQIDHTLLNALIYRDANASQLPRAGIVHRLDKLTSGVMVIARSLIAHTHLTAAIARRDVKREYDALVDGQVIAGGHIDHPIGRDRHQRTKMAICQKGKPAQTYYRVAEKFTHHTLLRCQLGSGRTHQIRVHLAAIGYPIVGDPQYNLHRHRLPGDDSTAKTTQYFQRQALHATRLAFIHPRTEACLVFEAPMPDDMANVLRTLRERDNAVSPSSTFS